MLMMKSVTITIPDLKSNTRTIDTSGENGRESACKY